ncbi:MAG: right-handed parallel beta-helix repeat-containing protein [Chitinophagaceae bacterium]|nr:right-handed parallel beta-helix repeat-containing protein [Chitinophagaceae bacterium]
MRLFITRCFLVPAFMAICFTSTAQTGERLKAGLLITKSMQIEKAVYLLEADSSLQMPLIRIAGKNLEVDFNQAILNGTMHPEQPDLMQGLAIRIEPGSENITIKNLSVHGYKIAVLADSVKQLSIVHCNFSYNWRPQLFSAREKEDERDWMSYHHNEAGEWKKQGAGIYLSHCNNAFINDNIIMGNQCALMMTNCENAKVYNNNFSFNSGLGIGLYRCSNNLIYHNQLDFNVRGFSLGKYRRGQDSAGILIFEQSSDNVFAYNSATHSGDGFFLWAGQYSMDTGKGGCNNNLIYGNDFSYAPTNGVELTFSSNSVLHNRIWGCDHGIWGGYSFDSDFSDNKILHNRIGIAIEHGQAINIAMNEIKYNGTAIKLWSNQKQSDDFAYAKFRNTQSKNYWIASNSIEENKIAYQLVGTDTVVFSGNKKTGNENDWKIGDRVSELDSSKELEFLDLDYQKDKRLTPIPYNDLPEQLFPQGMQEIRITKWGPYNFEYPILWLKQVDSNQVYHFEVLGKKGNWKLESLNGFEIIEQGADSFPSKILAKAKSQSGDQFIRLNYMGPEFIDAFGVLQKAATALVFEYKELPKIIPAEGGK